ncbi:methyltransferase domain-containing protein [Deferribacter autotrophicus]|uniref:Methyltransferase domain-containing protein n=1 Tax=Deferribacter autotrophicus TaxID=500465 RepID=A0A5A8F868_9BACT|nr:CheR family methyltransferase [Deferribacter autotrophicus]KAA0258228.1 methyltransferase domain-containing protein [Deferribacter autotrophicus]
MISDEQKIVEKILKIIQNEKNIDFTKYKFNTIFRRINHRLIMLGFKNILMYYNYLIKNVDKEIDVLVNLFLINTSEFFRDPLYFYIFDNLVNTLLKKGENYIKVLSIGCSTGEEVYTIFMILNEYREKNKNFEFKIVGVDLDEDAIIQANKATYSKSSIKNVPHSFVEKYFIKKNDSYIFNKELIPKDCITFIDENILEGKTRKIVGAFKYDFVFCRNLLIYLDKELQNELIKKITEILATNGYFIQGKSEYINKKYSKYFKEISSGVRIYKYLGERC